MSPSRLRYIAEDGLTGYAEAGDRLVTELRRQGITVAHERLARASPSGHTRTEPNARDRASYEPATADATTVAHLVPEHYAGLRRLHSNGCFIGHTVWETDRLPDHWPALLNEIDGLIVPTEWNRDVFVDGGVTVPTEVVPHIACSPQAGDGGVALDLADDLIVFYTIGRWDDRKAPWLVVEAFLNAFTADDPVALVVKTGELTERTRPLGSPDAGWLTPPAVDVARILSRHRRPPPIHIALGDWSPGRIAGLHERGDCFVSLTHGEGWGIGAFDASAHGNPVIITGWGGQLAYTDPAATRLVAHMLVPVAHSAPASYAPDQRWAEPDLDDAVEALREIAADLAGHRARAASHAEWVRREFSPAAVADTFLGALEALGIDRATLAG